MGVEFLLIGEILTKKGSSSNTLWTQIKLTGRKIYSAIFTTANMGLWQVGANVSY
jgi:hypothetical protein